MNRFDAIAKKYPRLEAFLDAVAPARKEGPLTEAEAAAVGKFRAKTGVTPADEQRLYVSLSASKRREKSIHASFPLESLIGGIRKSTSPQGVFFVLAHPLAV